MRRGRVCISAEQQSATFEASLKNGRKCFNLADELVPQAVPGAFAVDTAASGGYRCASRARATRLLTSLRVPAFGQSEPNTSYYRYPTFRSCGGLSS
jgi:hypothetical protein